MNAEEDELLAEANASLEAAQLLLTKGFVDYAASRAYYAMFHAAQALIAREGMSFSRHSAVIAAVGEHFARTGRLEARMHRYLLKAFEMRNAADYIPGPALSRADADEQLLHATEFVERVRDLLQEETAPGPE